jgi:FkbM family methyltransferase
MVAAVLPGSVKRRIKSAAHRLFPPPPSPTLALGRFGGFEVAYRQGTTDEAVIAHSFDHDIFFPGVPEYRPAPDHVILDVGAHIGTFALLAAAKVPHGKVYAVEASRESFNLLRINASLNRAHNIDATHVALSDRRGECTLYHDTGNWGHSIVAPMTGAGEAVPTETLADFFAAKHIHHCHFLKFNCEGAEFPILLATTPEVLARCGTLLVLYHGDLYGGDEAELMNHLRQSGFAISVRNQTERRGWIIAQNRAAAQRAA